MTGFPSPRSTSRTALAAVLLCALSLIGVSLTACGGKLDPLGNGTESSAGLPVNATKNTTRISATDSATAAAAASLAMWPGGDQRPASVALVPDDWRTALAAAPLTTPPFRSAILVADGEIPKATADALERLRPTGVPSAGNVKRIVVGDAEDPGDSKPINANGPAALADAIDRSRISSGAATTDSVVVVGTDGADWAAPAAAWSARSGDPVLFADKDGLPTETVDAIKRHGRPLIMLLAPTDVVSEKVEKLLNRYGAVARITASNPTDSSINFAKFRDGDRGWGLNVPGHGLLFAPVGEATQAIVMSPLSSGGDWPPLLMLADNGELPKNLKGYLLDIQPGYRGDPTRFLYNHGWLSGDTDAIPEATQAQIDGLLELKPANEAPTP